MREPDDKQARIAWDTLTPGQQLVLREEYGHYLDTLPPTCSLETKLERFRSWLAERGIGYPG